MKTIKTVGVAGAGAMGRGIAQIVAQAGLRVRLFDANAQATAAREAATGAAPDVLLILADARERAATDAATDAAREKAERKRRRDATRLRRPDAVKLQRWHPGVLAHARAAGGPAQPPERHHQNLAHGPPDELFGVFLSDERVVVGDAPVVKRRRRPTRGRRRAMARGPARRGPTAGGGSRQHLAPLHQGEAAGLAG